MFLSAFRIAVVTIAAGAVSNSYALCAMTINSSVDSLVTAVGSGGFQYGYTVSGSTQISCILPGDITSFSVPYFADGGISSISSPTGWSYAIKPTDSFALGSGAQTLIWTASPGYEIASSYWVTDPTTGQGVFTPLGHLSGFGYSASFAPVKGPFGIVTSTGFSGIGDPSIPGSPNAMAAGLTAPMPVSSVPETNSLVLSLIGLVAIWLRTRPGRRISVGAAVHPH